MASLLCLVLCIGLLSACQRKADPLTEDGFSSLSVNAERGVVDAVVSLSARTLQDKTGQIAFLYELLPGQTVSSLTSASEPLDQVRVSAYMKFRFDLFDGARSRLYSTFVVIFEDASSLLPTGHAIDNPEALATVTSPFLWADAPKGLFATDADDAFSLGARHTAVALSFSELLGEGADAVFTYGDTNVTYSSSALARLNSQILDAHRRGLQVSLSLTPDLTLSLQQTVAVLELLTSHYSTAEQGIISAVILQTPDTQTPASAARLCFLTHHALRSHVANGRVFVSAPHTSLEGTKAFFTDLRLSLAALGDVEWGACVSPVIALENGDNTTELLAFSDLSDLSASLFASSLDARASYFAVCGQATEGLSEDELAVSYAFAYRMAIAAKASLFLYPAHMDDAFGVRLSSGEERPLTAFFKNADTGLNEEQIALCEQILGKSFSALPTVKSSRTERNMAASLGYSQASTDPLYDFTTGDTHGFVGVGSATAPVCKNSSVFNAPVLYTWLAPAFGDEAGVCKVMQNGKSLSSAFSITVSMLAQVPDNTACKARLTLDGVSKSGGALSYEASTEIAAGSWQAVTFQISDFVADADLSRPCVMTLTVEPEIPVDEEYVLWIGAFDAAIPATPSAVWLPIALVLGGAALGFLVVAIIYRINGNRKPKKK